MSTCHALKTTAATKYFYGSPSTNLAGNKNLSLQCLPLIKHKCHCTEYGITEITTLPWNACFATMDSFRNTKKKVIKMNPPRRCFSVIILKLLIHNYSHASGIGMDRDTLKHMNSRSLQQASSWKADAPSAAPMSHCKLCASPKDLTAARAPSSLDSAYR